MTTPESLADTRGCPQRTVASGDRVLTLIDVELERLDDRSVYPPIGRWEWRRRRWQDGVFIARGVAAEKLREIRAAYVADELTREAEAMGLYDDNPFRPLVTTTAGEAMCPFCEHYSEWHKGLPFDGGPNGEWRYRCQCGCTVEGNVHRGLREVEV